MSGEAFDPLLDCYPSDLEMDFPSFDEEEDECGCEFDEHDWEPVLVEGGCYVIYECVHCGLIDTA